jgi:hypothetical protein
MGGALPHPFSLEETMEDSVQFSVTRIGFDKYRVIVQDEKRILRTYNFIRKAASPLEHLEGELVKLRIIGDKPNE